jgi:hypothetical protein
MGRLILELLRFGAETRHLALTIGLLLALLVGAVVALTSAVAPVVIYPFL